MPHTICGSPDCPLRFACRRSPDTDADPSPWGQPWATFEWIETRRGEVMCDGYRPARVQPAGPVRQFDQGRPVP